MKQNPLASGSGFFLLRIYSRSMVFSSETGYFDYWCFRFVVDDQLAIACPD